MASLVDANVAERLVGLCLVGGGIGWAIHPAWGLASAGGLILVFDVLDWLLTWANAKPKGTE
jgi:hypothetical protein